MLSVTDFRGNAGSRFMFPQPMYTGMISRLNDCIMNKKLQ